MERSEVNELYGEDATEWLKRWDADETIWSIEMGGLGPGYEQAIQQAAVELVRHMVNQQMDIDRWKDDTMWAADREAIYLWSLEWPAISKLGLSGAQYSAALNLAVNMYRDGPAEVMSHPEVQDRKIQVRRTFP